MIQPNSKARWSHLVSAFQNRLCKNRPAIFFYYSPSPPSSPPHSGFPLTRSFIFYDTSASLLLDSEDKATNS